jgi:uncharacterized membrane protein (DUF4010 family)
MTTTLAAGAVFFLCFNSHQQPGLTAFIGPLVALVLFAKKPLHHFTHKIRSNELEAAILLILLGVGVVDILVDQPADSWGLINPKKFGTIVLALATLEFVSYLAVRFLGPRKSTLVIGGLGGFVSSTAVLMTNAKDAATHPDEWRKHLIITWVAQIAALCEMLVIVAWISPELALAVLPAIGSGVAISIVIYGLLNWRQQETMHSLDKMKSPLNLKGVLRLAVLLALILGAVGAAQKLIGPAATQTLAFLAGLFDLHGITLATSTMVSQHQLSLEVARDSIVIAALASFFSKTVLAWMLSGWQHRSRFALTFSVLTVALAAIVAAVNWLSIFS